MLRAAIKEAHLDAFQQEIDNSSYMVLQLRQGKIIVSKRNK